MNVGIALVGIVGGLVVGVGLALQQRRDQALDELLSTVGITTVATVVSIVSTGRNLAFRRITVAVDGVGEFVQTLPFVEARELGLADGDQVSVRYVVDDQDRSVRGRLVGAPAERSLRTPVLAGAFIAVLGVVTALVV